MPSQAQTLLGALRCCTAAFSRYWNRETHENPDYFPTECTSVQSTYCFMIWTHIVQMPNMYDFISYSIPYKYLVVTWSVLTRLIWGPHQTPSCGVFEAHAFTLEQS
jgi:hypothetical protein